MRESPRIRTSSLARRRGASSACGRNDFLATLPRAQILAKRRALGFFGPSVGVETPKFPGGSAMSKKSRPADEGAWLAKDAFYVWRSRIKTAQLRIVVLSPYLDDLVRTLLKSSPLDQSCSTVVTNLDPCEVSPSLLKQVRSLRKLIADGVDVRHLDRLHAKVLLVDDAAVSIGSQNFTRFARRSRETTTFSGSESETTDAIREINAWVASSIEISDSLLAKIENDCAAHMRKLTRLNLEISESLQSILADHAHEITERELREQREAFELARRMEEERRRQINEDFDRLTHKSSRIVFARLKTFETQHTYWEWGVGRVSAGVSEYESLSPLYGASFEDVLPNLISKMWYPILFLDSRRFGFVRLGKTRMTYVKKGVICNRPFQFLDDWKWEVTINQRSGNANILVELVNWFGATVNVYMRFDGFHFSVTNVRSDSGDLHGIDEYFSDSERLAAFVEKYFSPFMFSDPLSGGKNVDEYLESNTSYRVALSEQATVPFLVVSPV